MPSRPPEARRRARLIYLTAFLYTFMMGMGYPLVPQFLRSLGATALVVGAVVGTYGVLQIFVRLPMGNLSDVHGRRTMLRVAFLAAVGAGVFFATAPSPIWVVPGQVLFGMAGGAFWVSANSYVKDLADAEAEARADDGSAARQEGAGDGSQATSVDPETGTGTGAGGLAGPGPGPMRRAMNHYGAAIAMGFLFGPPLGVVADIHGFRAGLSVFIWAGLAGLATTFLLEPLGRGDQPRLGLMAVYRRAAELLAVPDLRISLVCTFLYSMLFGLAAAFYPFYLRTVGFTAFLVGILYALRQVANSGANLLFARAGRGGDPLGTMLVGIGVTSLALALVPLYADFTPLLILALVAGVGFALMIPSNLTLIAEASPARETGLAMGIYGTGLGAGQLISPVVFGAVGEAWGLPWTFFGAGLTVLVLSIVVGLWAHGIDRVPPREALGPREGMA